MTAVDPVRRPRSGATASGRTTALTVEVPRGRPVGAWGMYLLVATEATFFACLLGSYFYIQFTHGGPWPPGGIAKPDVLKPLIMAALLVVSSGTIIASGRAIRTDGTGRMLLGIMITIVLGLAFLAMDALDYSEKLADFSWRTNAYGSFYFLITAFDALHLISGLIMLSWLFVAGALGKFSLGRHERVRMVSIYWNFVTAVWLVIVFTLYVSPHFSSWS